MTANAARRSAARYGRCDTKHIKHSVTSTSDRTMECIKKIIKYISRTKASSAITPNCAVSLRSKVSRPDAFNWKSFCFGVLSSCVLTLDLGQCASLVQSHQTHQNQSVHSYAAGEAVSSGNHSKRLNHEFNQASYLTAITSSSSPKILTTKPTFDSFNQSTGHQTIDKDAKLLNSSVSPSISSSVPNSVSSFVARSSNPSTHSSVRLNDSRSLARDVENKMKRRFAEDEQDKQKALESYKQKTQEKIQKWDAYQTNFTTLKKQILNSTNSSVPIYRHTKSTNRQFNHEGALNPISDNTLNDQLDEVDQLPDEDKDRYMDIGQFCKKCYCNSLKEGSLNCGKSNQLDSIPIIPSENRSTITEIFIEHQEHFTELNEGQLKYYPQITKLTIQNSGLKDIKERAFNSTRLLTKINLRHNQIKILQRKLFDDLQIHELSISDNPLACNCSVKWIQLWMMRPDRGRLGPSIENITCIENNSKIKKPVKELKVKGCEEPVAIVNISAITVHEGQNFTVRCDATGDPIPSITWIFQDARRKPNTTPNGNNLTLNTTLFNGTLSVNSTNPNGTNVIAALNASNSSGISKKIKTVTKTIELNASGYDNGPLYCYADNMVGKVVATVNVTVLAAPKIRFLKFDTKFNYCLNFSVTAFPVPKRTWYYNGTLVTPEKNPEIIKSGRYNFKETLTANGHSKRNRFVTTGCLEVNRERPHLTGIYKLEVENELGKEESAYELVLPQMPASTPYGLLADNSREDAKEARKPNYTLLSCTILFFLILIVVIVFVVGCDYSSKRTNYKENEIVAQEKIPMHLTRMVENPNYLQDKQQQMLHNFGNKQIERNRIELIKELGEGAFGRVYLGTVKDLEVTKNDNTFVAVKVLKDFEQITIDFDREATLLLELNHENIVTFYGVSIDKQPFMMIFEYMKLGDLNSFLRSFKESYSDTSNCGIVFTRMPTCQSFSQIKNTININNNIEEISKDSGLSTANTQTYTTTDQTEDDAKETDALIKQDHNRKISVRERQTATGDELYARSQDNQLNEPLVEAQKELSISDLFSISIQVCNGMRYLATAHFVHRDLATRNCLVTKENDRLIIKIGDFGMSRDIYDKDYYKVGGKQTALPIRWLPPESIMYRTFTLESDVWSYGILLWEVWTLGKQPFFELNNLEVIKQVDNGKRLDQPKNCPDAVYALMEACWKKEPKERASMFDIYDKLNDIYREISEQHNLTAK